MINLRIIAALSCAMAFIVTATPLPALGDSTGNGQMTAQWARISAPSIPHAVKINSAWHAAGEMYIRVDGQADVPVYSLSLNTAIDRTSQLQAVDSETSAVPHLDKVTYLIFRSNEDANHGALTDILSAAYQIAIWHLTANLPIDRTHVPDPAVRSDARKLIRATRANCTDSKCADDVSTAATSATLSLAVGKTVNDAVLRIAIITPITRFFNTRQYVDVRINGLGATLCPGETDRIRVDKPVTHNVLDSSCKYRGQDPSEQGQRTADLPRLTVERVSTNPANSVVNNVITALIPRQSNSQLVQILWPFSNDPGMIFMPTDFSSSVITASGFADTRTATTTIDPDDFLSFQQIIQQSILPIFTDHGWWGLALLVLLFVVALVLKDIVIGIAKSIGKFIGWCGKRISSLLKKKPKRRRARRQHGSSAADPDPS